MAKRDYKLGLRMSNFAGNGESPIGEVVRELWPKAFSRLSLRIASAMPGVVDKVMSQIRDRMVRENEKNGKAAGCESEAALAAVDAEETPMIS